MKKKAIINFSIIPKDDPKQALRIRRFFMAVTAAVLSSSLVYLSYLAGYTEWKAVAGLLVFIPIIAISVYILFRTGLNLKMADPSLTALQMSSAILTIMYVMYFANEARGVLLLSYIIIFLFGIFRLNTRSFLYISLFTLLTYGIDIILLKLYRPQGINFHIEYLQWVVLALVLVTFSIIGGYISSLRTKISKDRSTIKRMTDNIHDVVFVLDMNLHYTYVSPSVKMLRGYEPEEVMKQPLLDAMTPSSLDLACRTLSEVMELEKLEHKDDISRTLELEMRRKDGTTVWTEVKVSLIRDENQQPVSILGVTRDITERKRTSEVLQESEEQYRLVVENAKESIIVTQNIKVVFVNRAAIDMVGYSKEIFISKLFTDFIHPDDRNMVVDHHVRRVKGEEVPPVYPFRIIAQDGTVIWCELNATVTQWKGKPATLVFLTNITERKRADEELKESENKYRLLADNVLDVIFVLDVNLNYIYVSPSVKIQTGYEPEEVLQQTLAGTMTPASMDLVLRTLSEIREIEKSEHRDINISRTLELEMRRKDGTTVWTEVKVSLIRDENQQPVSILGITRDITDRKRMEGKLRFEEQRFRAFIEHSSDMIVLVNPEGVILYVNPAIESILGFKPEERIGSEGSEIVHPDDIKALADVFNTLSRDTNSPVMNAELRLRHKDGSWRTLEAVGSNLVNNNVVESIIINYRDITERKKAEEQIQYLVTHDLLTNLPSLRFAKDRLSVALNMARRYKKAVAVMFIDLDGFKDVNDTLGHDAGDYVLQQVAQRMLSCVRETDTVSRVGGDEFLIIATEINAPENVVQIAKKVIHLVSQPIIFNGSQAVVSASIGIALFPDDGQDMDQLIKKADEAMYRVKKGGKNGFCFISDTVN